MTIVRVGNSLQHLEEEEQGGASTGETVVGVRIADIERYRINILDGGRAAVFRGGRGRAHPPLQCWGQ